MSSAVASLRARTDSSPRTLALAVGDLLLISLFVVLGELQHGYDLVADAPRVVGTALPFFLGWALVSILAGVYAPSTSRSVGTAVRRTALAWIGAALIGQALRATPVFPGGFAIAFVLVSLGVGLVLLVPWRAAVAYVSSRG
ncbi:MULTISPECIES: DUF3054 domain-containing protein [Halococcus]|uniref:DUF3054 domain-containing protein n=1 Tax=Halococcus salifodinae DSM 8989 TaxID=1227456 RepID=M0N828_9EURY|nr:MULTISPECIES: DUF3054 domain-containing protein [Halococcus]EMA53279.1 hypothetical protein C450_08192 [Halococcus salifodinae DSM 8989]